MERSPTAERVTAVDGTSPQAVPSLPQLDERALAAPLELLANEARAKPGPEGAEALSRLNASLLTLQPTEANGAALLKLLDEGVLGALKADDGTSSRLVGIEALLRLGYPWAVKIRPEDLQWYRDVTRARRFRRWAAVGVVLLAVAGALAWVLTSLR